MADPLSITASCVGILSFGLTACKSVLEFYQSARGSRKDVHNLCETTETLCRVLELLRKTLERHGIEGNATAVFESVDACKVGVDRLMAKVNKIRQGTSSKGMRSIATAFQYPFRESTIAKLKEIVMHDLMGNLSIAMSVLHLDITSLNQRSVLSTLSSTNANLNSMRKDTSVGLRNVRQDVANLTVSMAAHQIEDRRDKIIRWISPSDYVTDAHKAACQQHEPKTGSWFLQSAYYIDWLDKAGSFMWLQGIPGCGKTILCSTIVEETKAFCAHHTSHYLAYYYFTFSDSVRQKTSTLLRSLLLQLLRQQLSVPDVLVDIYTRHSHDVPPEMELIHALRSLISATGQVYFILDALDECPATNGERAKLITLLKAFKGFELSNLHILSTSRMELDLSDMSQMVTSPPMNIQTSELDADIRLHIRNQLANDPKLRCWPSDLQGEIEAELTRGACGMFRWVSCQLESLRKCLRPSNARQTLKVLPKTLDDTYDRILLNTDEEYFSEAFRALTWLLFSARPLWLDELAEVMTIEPSSSPAFDPDERLFNPESALTLLSSLIVVVPKGTRKEIHLAHYSVKEYLSSPRASQSSASRFTIGHLQANERIMESCLHYMMCAKAACTEIERPHVDDGLERALKYTDIRPDPWKLQLKSRFPLLDYACTKWFFHAGAAKTESVMQLAAQFLDSEDDVNFWTRFFDPDEDGLMLDGGLKRHKEPNGSRASMYFAACLGLGDLVAFLLGNGADPNTKGGKYGNALQVASLKTHAGIVSTLLGAGANVNAKVGLLGNALQAACLSGSTEIVTLLVRAGADLNMEGYFPCTLGAVVGSLNPNPDVVLGILRHSTFDAQAPTPYSDYQYWRSQAQGWEVQKEPLPLEYSRSSVRTRFYVPTEDTRRWLLRWAVIKGHHAVARELLTRYPMVKLFDLTGLKQSTSGIYNVAISYRPNKSLLFEAVFYQRDNVVEKIMGLLFDSDNSQAISEQDDEGRSALYWACFKRSERTARLLLSNGADIHVEGPWGWTPRYWAFTRNDQRMLDLLNTACDSKSCSRCTHVEVVARAEMARLAKPAYSLVLYDLNVEMRGDDIDMT